MAGRKQKPCEWCEEEQIIRTDYDARNVSGTVEIYPDQMLLAICFQGMNDDGALTHEQSFDIPMNYCPHCGSNWGFYTKTTLVNVPYNWSFDGEAQDNSEMYDNAEHYKSGAYCYCQNCDKVICKVSTMARLLGRTEL